ncbi:MAG: hypothetical protein RIR39_431 [Pseudomonadota bacterium]
MSNISNRAPMKAIHYHWRPIILMGLAVLIVSIFWFTSRYPQLFSKVEHINDVLPSMVYSKQIMTVDLNAPIWLRIAASAVNWLNSMKIGMTFGVLFGALLHTVLRYYPLKLGNNRYLNSVKGALIGVPAGICANCAVPVICGMTRGRGRIEAALGFLFSSPNFNPVVVMMTFMALPLTMSLTKYAILLFLILVVMPSLILWFERDQPFQLLSVEKESGADIFGLLPKEDMPEHFTKVFHELAWEYGKHVWMLFKPTVTLMLFASIISATLLVFIPWDLILSEVTPLRLAFVSLISVIMPTPIALDVMFAAQLQRQGVASGYVMLFAMTLGTYSIIPFLYLWREISKPLAVALFGFFMALGVILGLLF